MRAPAAGSTVLLIGGRVSAAHHHHVNRVEDHIFSLIIDQDPKPHEAVAGTREDQRTIAEASVEIRAQRRGRRGVTAGEEQDNLALARGERHLHRAETGIHDLRPHASILACSLVSVARNNPPRVVIA